MRQKSRLNKIACFKKSIKPPISGGFFCLTWFYDYPKARNLLLAIGFSKFAKHAQGNPQKTKSQNLQF